MPRPLTFREWWRAFLELEELYPRILPLTLWRAWELAIYRRYRLRGPVLDVGCGDGRFFKQIWRRPPLADGLDLSPGALARAHSLGVYSHLYHAPAHAIPVKDAAYESAFSNCALEHMDHIDQVLAEVYRVVRPGGHFLFSVMTDKSVEWALLPVLLQQLGLPEMGIASWASYEEYHHLVNPFSTEEWLLRLERQGWRVREFWVILPEPFARVFLLADQLWHVGWEQGKELGVKLHGYLRTLSRYEEGLYHICKGLWHLMPPSEAQDGAGLIVWAERQ